MPQRRRVIARITDHKLLAAWMDRRDISIRQLAAEIGIHFTTLGALHSGRTTGCSAATGRLIEDALDCPRGTLFVSKVSPIADDEPHTEVSA